MSRFGGREVVMEKVLLRPHRTPVPERRRTLRDIYPRPQFDAVLHHERARADRDETEFSLMLIKVRSEDWRIMCRLARDLLRRARMTDEMGWYGHGCICVLLPNTPGAGARCFESSIRRLADAKGIGMVCRVYTYPSQWFIEIDRPSQPGPHLYRGNGNGNGNGNGHAHGNGNGNGNGNGHATSLHPMAKRQVQKRELTNFMLSGLVDGLEAEALGLEAIESLLVRPLPRWKRVMDVIFCATALVFLSPLLVLIALVIKLTSDGPILFGQWRAGLGGKPFWIYKFRTMVPDADVQKARLREMSEQDGPAFKMTCDPRVTRIGRLLRTTSLDELPQLWNVLRGDMSLVGPRPLPLDESAACRQWQRRRLDLTPGLTCIWQVKGRSRVTFAEWMRMDLAYARSRTLLHDMKIMAQTIPAVILRRGAR